MIRIGVVPTNDNDRDNQVFNSNLSSTYNTFLNELRSQTIDEFEINTVDNYYDRIDVLDLVIFLGKDWLVSYKTYKLKIPSIYIAQESPIIEKYHLTKNLIKLSSFFSLVMTWNKDLHGKSNFIPYFYTCSKNQFQELPSETEFFNRKLITQVSGNIKLNLPNELYSLRKRLNDECQRIMNDKYTFYGRGWNDKNEPSYGGQIGNKLELLNNYNFVFVIENCLTNNGYISEKILDAFISRTVPIYYGALNIPEMIPKGCYIYLNDFPGTNELIDYIKSMSYEEYLTYLEKCDEFFNNDDNPFLHQNLIDDLKTHIYDLTKDIFEYDIKIIELGFLLYWSLIIKFKRMIKCFLNRMGFSYKCFKL